eukprot:gb/GFBE01042281.1/.p1 GENE.gb/GFBE01042281.1/~~gb/GFBE01042281.1/.p1  ORF type:complete len:380 (+),score=55.29 gb/GFBE01042281.1/:1-1140(+)
MAPATSGRRRPWPHRQHCLRAFSAPFWMCCLCLPLAQLRSVEPFLFCGRPAPSSHGAAAPERLGRSSSIATAAQPQWPLDGPQKVMGRMTSSPGKRNVKVTRLKKGEKYRGAIDPRLRALVEAEEYRLVVDLMADLQDQNLLVEVLSRAEAYWDSLDIKVITQKERKLGGRAIMKALRKDWPRIFPPELEPLLEYRGVTNSFELFTTFWRRVEQSEVLDNLIDKVLPEEILDGQALDAMSTERRLDEIARRINTTSLANQYRILAENDTAVADLSPQVLPFLARALSALDNKIFAESGRVDLGKFADDAVGAAVVLSFILVLQIGGAIDIKLPSFDDELPKLERSKPTIRHIDSVAAEELALRGAAAKSAAATVADGGS